MRKSRELEEKNIECGIYDPHTAQLSAFTVLRMIHLMKQLDKNDPDYVHKLARYTATKEEHAELCKHEIRVLWGDYFKEEHLNEYKDLPNLVWKALKLGSKVRQEVNEEAAQELIKTVQEIAEIFWKTKGRETVRISAPYPTGGELVLPK